MRNGAKHGWLELVGLGMVVTLAGCNGQAAGPAKPDKPGKAVASAAPVAVPLDPQLNQPFKEAVLFDPPDDAQRPPDVTKAGKVVGKLFEAIAGKDNQGGLWDQVQFVSPTGKCLNYTARLQTDLGPIVIELWPHIAPNHVRNFVALARAGYYDGLDFERVHHEELVDAKGQVFEYVEAGCPLGTGDPGYGSIGYWLKPELSDKVHHEAGTVGAWHAEELESAACKFYITLTPAPWMDGNFTVFGKVIEGLDVVRRIAARPQRAEDPFDGRPLEPVSIRQVTIQVRESSCWAGPSN
jgi:peptidyl-prolyl cis-trans isomerase B (cyclophilin B)